MYRVIGVMFNTCLIRNLLSLRLIFLSFARIWQFFFCKYLSKRNTKEHQFPPFLVSYQLNLHYVRHMRFILPSATIFTEFMSWEVPHTSFRFHRFDVLNHFPIQPDLLVSSLLTENSHTLSITIITRYTIIKSKCTWRAMSAHDQMGRCAQR